MRFGMNDVPPHRTPEEWAQILADRGFRAASFPVDYRAPVSLIDAYVRAAKERDIMIAEVGIWNSPNHPDPDRAAQARRVCEEQFRLADYIRAECCVNVSGAAGPVWYGCYAKNYSEDVYKRNVEFIQELCDRVRPVYTCYTLENMQWMVPDSPEQYRKLLKDVDREHFAVHMDAVNLIRDPYTYTHKRELINRAFDLLGPWIRSCHLKDCILEDGVSVMIREVLPGEGSMGPDGAWQTLFERTEALGRDVPVLLEHLNGLEEYERALAACRRET